MINRRTFIGSAAAMALAPKAAGAAIGRTGHSVVVELFTSQGCSSCPPADTFLGELSQRDDVITLGFHVDYWDYIGWEDPFADPLFTSRQRAYGRALRNRTIYTPQMVIDGRFDRVGSRRLEVEAVIARLSGANAADRLSVPITLTRRINGDISVSIPDAAVPSGADVMMAITTGRHVTEIKRGENSGRTLIDHDVVRSLAKVGDYRGRSVDWAISAKTFSGSPNSLGDRLAIWLQAPDNGPIWGAATLALSPVG